MALAGLIAGVFIILVGARSFLTSGNYCFVA